MNLSYWEYKTWLSNVDFTIVGSGLVGLNCALTLRQKHPKAKIVVLEKGFLPQGASTKNAGFACFGSISEIVADLKQHTEEEVAQLVEKRWKGIHLLRKNLGDQHIDFETHGGHELFLTADAESYERCMLKIDEVNQLLKPVFGENAFQEQPNSFGFKGIQEQYITNSFESQLDTGKMMARLLNLVQNSGVLLLNAVTVNEFITKSSQVSVKTNHFEFQTNHLFIATNGFASELLHEEIKPARAQVLITNPIKDLHIKGTFHLDEGYYYFRNINGRILFGGGRNLDISAETTTDFGQTELIQDQLEEMLRNNILPDIDFEIDRRWSGIMGIGGQKSPIVKSISNRVHCGVRLGGMGIAIGSLVGKELAERI